MRFVVDAGAVIEVAGLPELVPRVNALKLRLLGDAVLRRRAWEIADELGWQSTYDAEFPLARKAEGVVALATLDDLR